MTLIRKKRSRVEAFPQEVIVEDGDKRNRCKLVASGVSALEVDPKLHQILAQRRAQSTTTKRVDETLRQAREQPKIDRAKARQNEISNKRAEVIEVSDEKPAFADGEMDQAIFECFQTNDYSRFIAFIRNGRHVNAARQCDRTTALMAACYHGNLHAAHELLQLGADPDQEDANGMTPKLFAKMYRDQSIGQKLFDMLTEYEFVYDVYEIDDASNGAIDNMGRATFSIHSGGALLFDDSTGRFVEYSHHEADEDFGRFDDGEDSNSNASGYVERQMMDEDEYLSNDDDDEYNDEKNSDFEESCALNQQKYHHQYQDDVDFEMEDDGYDGN